MIKIYKKIKLVILTVLFVTVALSSQASYTYKNVRISSTSSDSTGIFVRISVPQYDRYSCGSPIVIYLCGGFGAPSILSAMFNMSNYGFIVIQFNYPGGGKNAQLSGGTYDNRGPKCLLAAKDVTMFALGLKTDMSGKYLHEIITNHTPLYNNVGIIGGSNGGCQLISMLGKYPQDLGSVSWVSFFESPIGDGMLTADPGKPLGAKNVSVYHNDAYNDSTGVYNWDMFKYAPDSIVSRSKKDTIRGVFYFDINGNNTFNRGIDYDLMGQFNNPYSKKYFFSNQVVKKAYQFGYYPPTYTSIYFADSNETKSYWNIRNGENWIDDIMEVNQNLKVLFMVRDSDHITSAPDHPEVITTMNAFAENGCIWYRVNSDRSYIEYVTGLNLPTAPDNFANTEINHVNIRSMIMPGNIFPDRYMNHYSCALEMADRVMNEDWSLDLDGILPVTCPNTAKSEDETVDFNKTILFPNPAQNETYIQLNAIQSGISTITVYNSIGQQVLQTQNDAVVKGFNLLILDINNLSAGSYFVRIDAPGVNRTLQFTRE